MDSELSNPTSHHTGRRGEVEKRVHRLWQPSGYDDPWPRCEEVAKARNMPTGNAEPAPDGGRPQGLNEIKEILKRNQDMMLKLQEELDKSVSPPPAPPADNNVTAQAPNAPQSPSVSSPAPPVPSLVDASSLQLDDLPSPRHTGSSDTVLQLEQATETASSAASSSSISTTSPLRKLPRPPPIPGNVEQAPDSDCHEIDLLLIMSSPGGIFDFLEKYQDDIV